MQKSRSSDISDKRSIKVDVREETGFWGSIG